MNDNSEISISRSYSRKLSLKNYGGEQYEMCEMFASYSDTLPKGTPDGDQFKLSQELHRRAVADVEKAVTEYISGLAEKTKVALIEADKKRIDGIPLSEPTKEIPF